MICGLGRGKKQGKATALPCYLYKNAQAAIATAPPAFTHGGSSYGLPFFLVLFYIIIRKKKAAVQKRSQPRTFAAHMRGMRAHIYDNGQNCPKTKENFHGRSYIFS